MSYLRVIMTVFLLAGTSVAQDVDSDGVPDSVDNCPATYNPEQEDYDLDGVGDSCDNCIFVANTNQWDCDEDGTGDVCDESCTFCGNIDNDSECIVDVMDLAALFDYLYDGGPAPDAVRIADMDDYMGVNNGDVQELIGYWFIWSGSVVCNPTETSFPISEEIVEMRMLDVPPGRDTWTTELWVRLGAYDGYDGESYTGLAFSFSYACSTSAITLNSITPDIDPALWAHYGIAIDTVASTGLIGINSFRTGMEIGYWKFASMHFSLTPSSQTQRIVIDTITVAPSNVTVLSKSFRIHTVPQIFGIPGNMTCCVGGTGNVNCDPADNVDVADLSAMVQHMFLTQEPLCCRDEADVNNDGRIDISDLTRLVNHLFVTFEPLGPCPYE